MAKKVPANMKSQSGARRSSGPRRASNSIDREAPVKVKIIRAAESLFAERGFDATSLRDITKRARVNVAAINYYFASKDCLVQQVLDSRMTAYLAVRAESLDTYLRSLGTARPTLEGVAEALVRPMAEYSKDKAGARSLIRLLLHVRAQPTNESIRMFEDRVDPVAHRFVQAFHAAAPDLERAAVYWRYNFSVGATMQVLADADPATRRLRQLSGGLCDTNDDEAIIAALVEFIAAGFRQSK